MASKHTNFQFTYSPDMNHDADLHTADQIKQADAIDRQIGYILGASILIIVAIMTAIVIGSMNGSVTIGG